MNKIKYMCKHSDCNNEVYVAGGSCVTCQNKPAKQTRIINDWAPETRSLLKDLIDAGCALRSGDNGEERFSFDGDLNKFIENLIACDEAHLYITAPDGKKLWIYLVLGNEPGVIASDYTVHTVLDAVTEAHYNKWCDRKQPTKEVTL